MIPKNNHVFNPGYCHEQELRHMGFKSVGKNVSVFRNCIVIGMENISIGDNVRIDGFCSIIALEPGYLNIGSFVHIGGYCHLSASDGISMEDFSGLSQGVKMYSRSDDYSGTCLTNPMIPPRYKKPSRGPVLLKRHVIIGSGTVILPQVTIDEGSAVGALSLVTKSLPSWSIYAGCPVKKLRDRSKNILDLERDLRFGLG